jgi:hypothetical protein
MVTGACWAAAGFTFYQNVHLHCLEEELKQTTCGGLVIEDFPDCPVNFDIHQVLEGEIRLPQDLGERLDRAMKINLDMLRRQNA